jgi:hypothetical protein
MAISIDWATKIITHPQADLTPVTGTLYELDTEAFRNELHTLQASEEGMSYDAIFSHNTEVTVVGVTYARFIQFINGYSVIFTPDSAWSVRFAGSNNNFFDVENGFLQQNNVQVIPQNSAGLINTSGSSSSGSGTDEQERLIKLLLVRQEDHTYSHEKHAKLEVEHRKELEEYIKRREGRQR